MIDTIHRWAQASSTLGWPAAVLLGVGFLVVSTLLGLVMVLALPADYFVRKPDARGFWQSHVVLRVVFVIAKNLLGWLALLAGLVMAIPMVPGPGVVFVLVGLAAVDFPGKRALERRLLANPRVLVSVNKLRARFGRPPLAAASSGDP